MLSPQDSLQRSESQDLSKSSQHPLSPYFELVCDLGAGDTEVRQRGPLPSGASGQMCVCEEGGANKLAMTTQGDR